MPSVEKELMMKEITEGFEKNPYAFFSTFQGVSVQELSQARKNLEKVSNRSLVLKHSFARKIFEKLNIRNTEPFLKDSVLVTFGDKEPQEISKAIVEFTKSCKNLKPAGVVFEGETQGEAFVRDLAKLPSRKELLTQILLRINAPVSGLVNALGGLSRNLVLVLEELRKKKEAAGASA